MVQAFHLNKPFSSFRKTVQNDLNSNHHIVNNANLVKLRASGTGIQGACHWLEFVGQTARNLNTSLPLSLLSTLVE
jgi:hypothetical protein